MNKTIRSTVFGKCMRQRVVPSTTIEKIKIRSVAQLALTIDHRILDGSEAAALLNATAELVGDPGLALIYS